MIFQRPNNFKNARYVGGIFDIKDLVLMIFFEIILVIALLIYISVTEQILPFVVVFLVVPMIFVGVINVKFPVFHNLRIYFWSLYQYSKRLRLFTWEGRYRYEAKETKEANND